MIFFVDNNGKIINSQPETVYQGAADTNNIYLIAPFAANLSFAVAFTLPNGAYTERYMMTPGKQLDDVEYSPTQNIFALWKMSVPSNITQYFGTVKAQFYTYATDGAITPTSATSFVVSQGVPEELPATPSQDIYNQILTALSQLQSQLNNGTFAARAIYWWIDTFTYGMNEITFYPLGEYGALIRSVATNNEGNAPYDDEGNLNSAYWQELVDFNKALNAIEEAAKSAAEAAQSATESAQSAAQSAASASAAAASEQNAAQSAQNAATSESNAAQSAEDAEQSAQDAAQSAQQAESSATDAAQSAVDAEESAQSVKDYLNKTTEFVSKLPETGDPNVLYFVAGEDDNLFSIWIWKDNSWKQIGTSSLNVNGLALQSDLNKEITDRKAADKDIQAELKNKQSTITGAASSVTDQDLTENRALVSDSDGKISESAVTSVELGYLSGATDNIQNQIDSIGSGTIVKTAAEWASDNTVLEAGVFGYDSTNNITKIGDGVTPWINLTIFVTTDANFAVSSWAKIAEISEGGQAQDYFKIGDERTIKLSTGEEITLVILGFNYDDLGDGSGKAGMSIGMKNLLSTKYSMNSGSVSIFQWDESNMRKTVISTLFSQLPSDLRSVIKTVQKTSEYVNLSTVDYLTTNDKIFLFSQTEVGLRLIGDAYEYYKNGTDVRVKYLSNGSGAVSYWWTRDGYRDECTAVNTRGVAYDDDPTTPYGICFGFCI